MTDRQITVCGVWCEVSGNRDVQMRKHKAKQVTKGGFVNSLYNETSVFTLVMPCQSQRQSLHTTTLLAGSITACGGCFFPKGTAFRLGTVGYGCASLDGHVIKLLPDGSTGRGGKRLAYVRVVNETS